MKKYKLLKDMPMHPAGTICKITQTCGADDETIRELVRVAGDEQNLVMFENEIRVIRKDGKFDEWFEEIEESKIWRPKEEETYYYITAYGELSTAKNHSTDIDDRMFGFGNCFKTQEDAEKVLEKLKTLRRLREAGLKAGDRMTWGSNNNIIIPVHVPKDGLDMAARDALFADLIKVCGVGEEDA